MLNKPIFLIGAARSGTTLLGEILSQHKELAYWVEPKYIWKYRSPNVYDDFRSEKDVTNDVQNFISNKFTSFLIKNNKSRFLEKTPSNCFRISFIESIFPDAIYINIIRDGRDVTLSAYKKWTEKHDKSAYSRRLSLSEFPIVDLPFYLFHFVNQFFGQQFNSGNLKMWGPMSPEIRKFLDRSIEEACAFQWKESTEQSFKDLSKIDSNRVITIKYEELLSDPIKFLCQILDVCNLSYSNDVISYANRVIRSDNSRKWIDSEIISKVDYILNPSLKDLGYI